MKKLLSLLLCGMFGLAVFLTGCGNGLTNVENTEKGIIYNGGSVAMVGDYLFFANGFASDHASMEDMAAYNNATKYAGLNRVQKDNVNSATLYAPSDKVEKVSQNDLVGMAQTYMFAYGDNLYYVAPTTHKTNENKIAFDHLSVFKINYNGTGRSEIFYTESAFDTTNGKIVALEYNNVAYIMIYDGANLVTIDITNGGTKTNLDEVTSVAFPQEYADWNGVLYFTKDADASTSGNEVYQIKVDGTNETQLTREGELSETVKFIERYDDQVFFTMGEEGAEVSHTYLADASDIDSSFFTAAGEIYYYSAISDVIKVCTEESLSRLAGFIFTSNGVVMYQNEFTQEDPQVLIDSSTYSNAKVIAAIGEYVYFSTASGIYKVSLSTKQIVELVTEMTITTGVCGYTYQMLDGEKVALDKIYFYAQREYDEEDEDVDTSDENVYLYQVSANGGDVKMVGDPIEVETKEEE